MFRRRDIEPKEFDTRMLTDICTNLENSENDTAIRDHNMCLLQDELESLIYGLYKTYIIDYTYETKGLDSDAMKQERADVLSYVHKRIRKLRTIVDHIEPNVIDRLVCEIFK